MATGSKKHIHKYMHAQLKFAKVWRCGLANCYHYMPPHMEELLIGRSSICWNCGNQFALNEDSMKDEMPTCFGCKQEVIETLVGDTTALNLFINQKLSDSSKK